MVITYKFALIKMVAFKHSLSHLTYRLYSNKAIVRNGKECKKLPPETLRILPYLIEKYD